MKNSINQRAGKLANGLRTAWCVASALLLVVSVLGARLDAQVADFDPQRFAGAMKRFARADTEEPPAIGGVVIVGSSSVRRLDAETVFPDVPVIQRGFGGAHISDINHYAEQTVLKYEPSTVIFFCGGNDLWVGHSIEEVVEDYRQFCERLFNRVPNCKLITLAIRPSPKRRRLLETVLKANDELTRVAALDDRIVFLRGSCDRFLSNTGEPIASMYAPDNQHMNERGYAVWTEIVMPHLGDSVRGAALATGGEAE